MRPAEKKSTTLSPPFPYPSLEALDRSMQASRGQRLAGERDEERDAEKGRTDDSSATPSRPPLRPAGWLSLPDDRGTQSGCSRKSKTFFLSLSATPARPRPPSSSRPARRATPASDAPAATDDATYAPLPRAALERGPVAAMVKVREGNRQRKGNPFFFLMHQAPLSSGRRLSHCLCRRPVARVVCDIEFWRASFSAGEHSASASDPLQL